MRYLFVLSRIKIVFLSLAFLVSIGGAGDEKGYLVISCDRVGALIYVDEEPVGRTPLEKMELASGYHTVSFFSSETIENGYWKFRDASFFKKTGALANLGRIEAGTERVKVETGKTTFVDLDYDEVEKAGGRVKRTIYGCVLGNTIIGILVGVALGLLISH